MGVSPPVLAQIGDAFVADLQSEVEEALALYRGAEQERVQLSILQLAAGDLGEVYRYVECALQDYRDILYWAEYPDESELDTPEKRERIRQLFVRLGLELPRELKDDE